LARIIPPPPEEFKVSCKNSSAFELAGSEMDQNLLPRLELGGGGATVLAKNLGVFN
jgi:hypothetical protein